MRLLKGTITIFILALIGAPIIESCKKGPDDPGISFRSRTNRLTGTWMLKEVDYKQVLDYKSVMTNDANDYKEITTENTTSTVTFDGSEWVDSYDKNEVEEDEAGSDCGTDATDESGSEAYNRTYEVDSILLTFYDDHTVTMKVIHGLTDGEICATNVDGDETCSDVTTGDRDTMHTTSQGEWYWNKKKEEKIEVVFASGTGFNIGNKNGIDVAPLGELMTVLDVNVFQGNIDRLANSEIIIERNDEWTNDTKDVMESNFLCDPQGGTKEGEVTTVTSSTTKSSYMEKWVKVNKEDERSDAGIEGTGGGDEE